MAKHISPEWGLPVGYHDDKAIYDLYGRIVGQLRGSHVYCMAGHHVGKLENGTILSTSHGTSPCTNDDKNDKGHARLRTRRLAK